MKTFITLLVTLLPTLTFAQTTYNLDWFSGVSVADASVTIEVGDTVEWTWMDALPHTVSSDNDAAEFFESGTITGMGQTFSHTFTVVGENGYECEIHSNMDGIITVVSSLGIEDKFRANLKHYPNPVRETLTVTSLLVLDQYKVYDIHGKVLHTKAVQSNVLDIDFSQLATGVYFVQVYSNGISETLQVINK